MDFFIEILGLIGIVIGIGLGITLILLFFKSLSSKDYNFENNKKNKTTTNSKDKLSADKIREIIIAAQLAKKNNNTSNPIYNKINTELEETGFKQNEEDNCRDNNTQKKSSNFKFELNELQALFFMMNKIGLTDGELSEKEQAFNNSIIEEIPGFKLVSDWKNFVDDSFVLKVEDCLKILIIMDFEKRVIVMKVLVSLAASDGKIVYEELTALQELKFLLEVKESDLKLNPTTDYLDNKILDFRNQALKYSSKK